MRTNYRGTGLGLSIVKSLIDRMGGTVNVESRQGEGSRVDISLPFVAAADDGTDNAADADENGAAGADDSTASASDADEAGKECKKNSEDTEKENTEKMPLAGKKILLAEDNELNMEIARFMLEDAGAEVVSAYDGREAVNIYDESPEGAFDAVLMDIMMPNMDGYVATRAIRRSGRSDAGTLPIIAVTAHAFDDDRKTSLAAGMDEHLTKPLDSHKLVETVLRLCS